MRPRRPGELRWRAPVRPEPWTEVADATVYGAVCPQPKSPIPMGAGTRASEDCLFLNVWAPSGSVAGAGLPVLVWVHGGAYIFGSGSQPLYDARALVSGAADSGDGSGAVVVTLNYRMGALGFLELSGFDAGDRRFDSNLGLRDVLRALQWVQENIAAFGGDPQQVTLFGESAGGGIVTTLLTSPAAAGLFSRAIAQSSPATSVYDTARAHTVAELVLDRLGSDCGTSDVDAGAGPCRRLHPCIRPHTQHRPGHAGVRAHRRRRRGARLPGETGPRGTLAPGAADHRNQPGRGVTVPVHEVAADADRAEGHPDDVLRTRRRAARPGVAVEGSGRFGVRRYPDPGLGRAHRPRRRLPDADRVAGRRAQCRCTGAPLPLRLGHPGCSACCDSGRRTPPNCPMSGAISWAGPGMSPSSWVASNTVWRCRGGCVPGG